MATNPYADGCAFIEGKYLPIAEAHSDPGFRILPVGSKLGCCSGLERH